MHDGPFPDIFMLIRRLSPSLPWALAFTLVEMVVASAILAVILLLVFGITQQTSVAWKNSAAKIESFQGARAAFESMTRRIGQATLNTYYDYFDMSNKRRADYAGNTAALASFVPDKYGRHSDLHFITGKNLLDGRGALPDQITHAIFFQAPTGYSNDLSYRGLDTTLNAAGYYIEYGPDHFRPEFLGAPARNRFRLMQLSQPTQDLLVYSGDTDRLSWFKSPLEKSSDPTQPDPRPAYQLGENIVALIVRPKRSEIDSASQGELAPNFEYDSRTTAPWTGRQPLIQHQLPPLVEVVMVAVDEPSFILFNNPNTAPNLGQNELFQQTGDLPQDLLDFEDILNAEPGNPVNQTKLRYLIFRLEIPIRAAKWSE